VYNSKKISYIKNQKTRNLFPSNHHSRPQDPPKTTGPSLGKAVKSRIPGPLNGPLKNLLLKNKIKN